MTSGIINTKFETVKKAIEAQGFVVDETMRIKDWYGIIAHKPAPEEA